MPLSLFAMMDSVTMRRRPVRCGKSRALAPTGVRGAKDGRSGINRQFKVNAATELTLLGLAAATAGGVAWVNDYFVFSIILMALGGIALGYVVAASR
jgi:hypothetical protein